MYLILNPQNQHGKKPHAPNVLRAATQFMNPLKMNLFIQVKLAV
jgi:hypothetical protein